MFRMIAVGTLALALMGLGAGVAQAASKSDAFKVQPGTVVGVVADASGKAVAGVAVRMSGEGRVVEAQTDKSGAFSLKNVVAGRYDLYVGGAKPSKVVASTEATSGLLYVVVEKPKSANAEPGSALLITGYIVGGVFVVGGGTAVAANNNWIGGSFVQAFDNVTGTTYQQDKKDKPVTP